MGISSIEWTYYTLNLWWGCQEIFDLDGPDGQDPACHDCYARVRAANPYWWGKQTLFPVWGNDVGRRFFNEEHYLEPLKWNRAAERDKVARRVFCMSMGDWAEGRPDQKPILDRWLYPIVEQTPWLIWLLLTKRPQLANSLVPEHWRRDGWPVNAWPGTTAVTQKWADIRIPHLLRIPASHHFISAEPLTEDITLRTEWISGPFRGDIPRVAGEACLPRNLIDWVIVGGQSGKDAVPMNPAWPRSLRDQCAAAGVSFHYKQWGEWAPAGAKRPGTPGRFALIPTGFDEPSIELTEFPTSSTASGSVVMERVGKKAAGRLLDGREWNELPPL